MFNFLIVQFTKLNFNSQNKIILFTGEIDYVVSINLYVIAMLLFVIIQYLIVAVIGVYLLVKLFSKSRAKFIVGVVHGALGLLGLAFIIILISFQKGDTPIVSFLFLLMAFFFGAGMVVTTLSEKKFPKFIAIVHAALAITGICFLISFWLSQ